MKKIVLIEDDPDLFSLVEYNLEKEGFVVAGAQTGKGAVELRQRERPDLIILDIMLPDSDGLEICKGIRGNIGTGARAGHFPDGARFGNGSDRRPGTGRERLHRQAVLRPRTDRARQDPFPWSAAGSKLLKAGDLELDRARCRVHLTGAEVTLTATEFRLLEFLMSRPGVVFSREQLLDAVWGHDRAVTDRTVDVYILRLRQKIEVDETSPFIRSVRGFGYSFNSEVPAETLR